MIFHFGGETQHYVSVCISPGYVSQALAGGSQFISTSIALTLLTGFPEGEADIVSGTATELSLDPFQSEGKNVLPPVRGGQCFLLPIHHC